MAVSLRLQAVLDFVQDSNVLADIGTDHAYLPIEACKANFCNTAIACDINKGPLNIADSNIRAAGLAGRIQTRLGDGLVPLMQNEADCVAICGMGGMRIWNILQAEPEKAKFAKKIILQPQHDLEELRKNLHSAGYNISAEKLVMEDGRFYVILLAEYFGEVEVWTQQEYFLGKFLQESPHFTEYLQQHREKIGRYIQSVRDCAARQIAKTKLEWVDNACQMLNG